MRSPVSARHRRASADASPSPLALLARACCGGRTHVRKPTSSRLNRPSCRPPGSSTARRSRTAVGSSHAYGRQLYGRRMSSSPWQPTCKGGCVRRRGGRFARPMRTAGSCTAGGCPRGPGSRPARRIKTWHACHSTAHVHCGWAGNGCGAEGDLSER
eukprot:365267-Chlamydomonas_euryale.AAC.7